MNFVLDTNVYFAAIHTPGFLERYRETLLKIAPRMYLSSVVRAELLQGARGDVGRACIHRAARQLEQTRRVVAPAHADWIRAGVVQGKIWDELPALRTKRMLNDILIVCGLRAIGAMLVTDNVADFAVIRRLLFVGRGDGLDPPHVPEEPAPRDRRS